MPLTFLLSFFSSVPEEDAFGLNLPREDKISGTLTSNAHRNAVARDNACVWHLRVRVSNDFLKDDDDVADPVEEVRRSLYLSLGQGAKLSGRQHFITARQSIWLGDPCIRPPLFWFTNPLDALVCPSVCRGNSTGTPHALASRRHCASPLMHRILSERRATAEVGSCALFFVGEFSGEGEESIRPKEAPPVGDNADCCLAAVLFKSGGDWDTVQCRIRINAADAEVRRRDLSSADDGIPPPRFTGSLVLDEQW